MPLLKELGKNHGHAVAINMALYGAFKTSPLGGILRNLRDGWILVLAELKLASTAHIDHWYITRGWFAMGLLALIHQLQGIFVNLLRLAGLLIPVGVIGHYFLEAYCKPVHFRPDLRVLQQCFGNLRAHIF